MQAQLQGVEIKSIILNNDDLSIEDTTSRQSRLQRRKELRKVAVQRFLVAALYQNLVAIAKYQRAKAVPLRFEDPISIGRQFTHSLGQHRQYGRIYGKVHAFMVAEL